MSVGSAAIEYLMSNRESILKAWVEAQMEDPRVRADAIGQAELELQSARILDAFIRAGTTAKVSDPDDPAFDDVRRILSEISLRRERLGLRALGTAVAVMILKDWWTLPMVAEESASAQLQDEARAITRLLDTLALSTYEELVARRESTIRQQAEELVEISTPVIKVWEGVVAAPLIGTLDSDRTQRFMERLLETIAATNSPVALVDITGVPTIDTQTAQHLIDTVSAVRLLGSRLILTGVRPSIAQTLVHLGINMTDITTRASFAGGLRVAMDLLSLEVTNVDSGE